MTVSLPSGTSSHVSVKIVWDMAYRFSGLWLCHSHSW